MMESLLRDGVALVAPQASTLAVVAAAIAATWGVRRLMDFLSVGRHVDRSSPKHGGQIVVDVLKAHNVQHVFTLCGGHISPVLVAGEAAGLRIVDVRHEATAVFAADAVARLTGVPGVAVVTAGPGITNTITAVKNAQMAESPILLLGGAAATLLKGRGALQDIDQMTLLAPLCKFAATVTRVRDIAPTLRRALAVAQSEVPGPVFVELPIDILYPYNLVVREMGRSAQGSRAKSLTQRLVGFYLDCFVDRIFADAFERVDVSPLPIDIPVVSAIDIARAAGAIAGSKRPVFVLGSQSMLPPMDVAAVRAALEQMGIPAYLGGMARGLLGRASPIHMRQCRREALREADCVVLVGVSVDFRLDYGRVLPRSGKVIMVNRNPWASRQNADLFWRPHLSFVGDPGSFLVALAAHLQHGHQYVAPSEWVQALRARDEQKEGANKAKASEATDFVNPLHFLDRLEAQLSDKSILVADGGDFVGSAAYILRPRAPLAWLDPGAFGTLGVGGGFALGAKLCRPDADVWIVWGDGSCGYSIAEFDTFERHKLGVIGVVGNDGAWTQIAREQEPMLGSSVGCMLARRDYHTVAEGLGGCGEVVRCDGDIDGALSRAVERSRHGQPVLVNVLIGTTDFRKGSISA